MSAGIFNSLTNLTGLGLDNNQLTELPAGIFNSLGRLQILGLGDNPLERLPTGIFNTLGNLRVLGLDNNSLERLPDRIFSDLGSLEGVIVGERDENGTVTASLPLNVTIQESTVGSVVVEVAQGVPFTTVTATLSITGGDFSGNLSTTVTIQKGQTQSAPITFATDQTAETTVIGISRLTSDPLEIETGFDDRSFVGYSGFQLAEGPALFLGEGVCNRTPQVRDAILARIGSGATCSTVTDVQLASISGTLDLRDPTPLDARGQTDDDITTLLVGDFAGLTRLEELDLSENSLTTLPPGIFSDLTALTRLDLFDNSLTTLSPGVFSDLTALTRLDLGFNDLTTSMVSRSGLNALTNLTILDLSANQLGELPSDIFAGLTALRTLTLDQNQLTALPARLLSGLTALRTLTLNQNQLTALPAGLFSGLGMLRGVDMSGNTTDPLTLTVIPKVISEGMAVVEVAQSVPFTRVTATAEITGGTIGDSTATRIQVSISRGETQSAPFSFIANDMFSMTILSFSVSEDISDGFDNMTGLGYSGFQLASGPDLTLPGVTLQGGICDRTPQVQTSILAAIGGRVTCSTVTEDQLAEINGRLSLSNRNIRSLQIGDFAGLTALQELYLSDNDLSSLPADLFADLTALTYLDLGDNDLRELPATLFTGLTALQELDLSDNGLRELPENLFAGLTTLTSLRLNGNSLSRLDAALFANLELRLLWLHVNDLSTLPANLFAGLTALTELDLGDNNLRELPADLFAGLTALTNLDLGDNELRELSAGLFSVLPT